jgi:hypothetical protein
MEGHTIVGIVSLVAGILVLTLGITIFVLWIRSQKRVIKSISSPDEPTDDIDERIDGIVNPSISESVVPAIDFDVQIEIPPNEEPSVGLEPIPIMWDWNTCPYENRTVATCVQCRLPCSHRHELMNGDWQMD